MMRGEEKQLIFQIQNTFIPIQFTDNFVFGLNYSCGKKHCCKKYKKPGKKRCKKCPDRN